MPKLLLTGVTGTFGLAFLSYSKWQGRIIGLARGEQELDRLRRMDLPNFRIIQGDVRDPQKLRMAMKDVDLVVHSAALKIVPNGAYNLDEMIATNVLGTLNVIREAIHAGVEKVLLLSTDKACEPTTSYGATKLLIEHLAYQTNDWSDTAISCTRWGNVIDSRGSFTLDIQNWKAGDPPLKLTDERCTRFWISQQAAVRFTDMVLEKAEGGEIWVPKCIAKRVVDLIPPDVTWQEVGLRSTEKLHETLVGADELKRTHETPTYFVCYQTPRPGNQTPTEPYTSASSQHEAPDLSPRQGERVESSTS